MSVPRPAMLVAMVTVPGRPACAMMRDSASWCLAFSTWWAILSSFSMPDRYSETSIEAVPTSTGWRRSTQSPMSATMALNFSSPVI